MKCTALIAAIAITAFLYCLGNGIAGGSGTETTNSFAFLEDGVPAKGCKIFLIDSKQWLSQAGSGNFIVDSAIAHIDGEFSFEYENSGKNKNLAIQIDHDYSGLFKRNVSFGDIDGATFVLGKYSSIHGTLQGVQALTPVKIDGTTYSAVTTDDGAFVIEKVPQGLYALFAQSDEGFSAAGSVKLPSDSLATVVLQPRSDDAILITDFECGFKSPVSAAYGVELFWYIFSDSVDKGYDYELLQWVNSNSSEDDVKSGNSSIDCIVGNDSEGFHSLQINGELDQACSFPYAGVGVVLYTEGFNGVDLHGADSLEFEAKGIGRMKIVFIVEHPVENKQVRFSEVFDLNDTSSSIAVNLKSLNMPSSVADSNRVSWEEACGEVKMIEFAFYGPDNATATAFSVDIDNVVFIGNGIRETLVK